MGRRKRGGLGGQKLVGIILALAGAFILIDIIPVYVWWLILALGLILVGWFLFNS